MRKHNIKPEDLNFLIKLAEAGLESEANLIMSEFGCVINELDNQYKNLPAPYKLMQFSGALERLATQLTRLNSLKSRK